MKFTTYIAKRFMLGGKGAGASRFTGWIAIIGMAIGSFAMVISIAVLNGFELQVTEKIIGFEGDLRISKFKANETDNIHTQLENDSDITQVSPFMERKGVVITDNKNVRMVTFKAVPFEKVDEFYNLGLEETLVNPDKPRIYLGTLLAERLQLTIGDDIKLMSPIDAPVQLGLPRVLSAQVAGIFKVDVLDYDDRIVFLPLKYGKSLFLRKKGVDGFDLRLIDREIVYDVKTQLKQQFNGNIRIENWEDIHQGLFNAMRMEKIGAIIVLSLIIMVAAFNLTSTLVLVTYQKIREIGILRTLGASARVIKSVIVKQGLLIGGIGAMIGIIVSIALVMMQDIFGFLPLPKDIYAFDQLPMMLKPSDIILVPFIAFLLIILSAYIAARRAMLIEPKEAVHLDK